MTHTARKAVSTRCARVKRPSVACLRLAKSVLAATGRAMKTMSHPGLSGTARRISRRRRFTLFLTTASPTLLLTEIPYRDNISPLGKALITSRSHAHDSPFSYTRAYSFGLVINLPPVTPPRANFTLRLRSIASDPLVALLSEPPDRPGCSFFSESHAPAFLVSSLADRFSLAKYP